MSGLGFRLPAKVDRIVDGDTLELRLERVLKIRLVSCWAPESRTRDEVEKELGLKAKEKLEELLPIGLDVEVEIDIESDEAFGGRMSFGRILGRVKASGVDVSEFLVGLGVAAADRDGCRRIVEEEKIRRGLQ